MGNILAIDQGTTSTRALIFNSQKEKFISQAQKEHTQIYPQAGYVEHDANEIWSNVITVCNQAVGNIGGWGQIKAIGITNQRETTLVWDNKTGNLLSNAIVWQCRRTSDIIESLIRDGYKDVFHKKTGLVLDAYFSGSKIKWLLENNSNTVKNAYEKKTLRFGTIDSYLIFKMTGKHVIDVSNASRTLLFDLKDKFWSDELLEILKIPDWILPEIIPSVVYDPNGRYWVREGHRIPILGVSGDQSGALFGQTAFYEGESKVTYGTGNFALVNTGTSIKYSNKGLLSTVGWSIDHISNMVYALEGSVFITGALIQWFRDELQIIDETHQIEELAQKSGDIGDLIIVPAFVGLGAPYWNQNARGAIFGITRGTNRNHFALAALESIALQTYDVVTLLEKESQSIINSIRVDGGASLNNYLMQIQANLLRKRVIRSRIVETTALGAALMAGIGAEIWSSLDELKNKFTPEKSFIPNLNYDREFKINLWKKAINRILDWTES